MGLVIWCLAVLLLVSAVAARLDIIATTTLVLAGVSGSLAAFVLRRSLWQKLEHFGTAIRVLLPI